MCTLAARGLWMEMLCIMAEAKPIGHLVIEGLAPTDTQLAMLAGAPPDQVPELLVELESAGVFSRSVEGVIFSRRMVDDDKKARTARRNGRRGGNPNLMKDKEKPPGVNQQDKGGHKTQKPETRSQIVPNSSEFGRSAPQDWKADLFGDCLEWVAGVEGKPPDRCRSLLGRWLKLTGDDARAVVEIIDAARAEQKAQPVEWITACLQDRKREEEKHGPGVYSLIAAER